MQNRPSLAYCHYFFQREELRVICGTQGVPDTVAPFRAWRGSRDLIAQSPKLHALAVATKLQRFAPELRDCNSSLTHTTRHSFNSAVPEVSAAKSLPAVPLLWKHSQNISIAFHHCCTLPTDGSSPSTRVSLQPGRVVRGASGTH